MVKRLLLITIIAGLQIAAVAQKSAARFKLLTYGLPDFIKQNAKDVIVDKWGIEFYPVAGCGVSKELEDSVEQHNKSVEALITKKYGPQWKKRLYKEVNEEFARQEKILALVESLDYVKKKKEEMFTNNEIFFNLLTPIPHTYKYDVQIRGWEQYNGEDIFFRFYQFEVNYKTQKITLLSNKKIKQGDKRFTDK